MEVSAKGCDAVSENKREVLLINRDEVVVNGVEEGIMFIEHTWKEEVVTVD